MTEAECALPSVSLVVAAADNGVIGRDGALPWHLPDDLKFFKSVTLGKPVLMGRRTHESIGRPLPGRRNLVLTRAAPDARGGATRAAADAGVEYVSSLEAARELARGASELCVIGGAEVYALALPSATRVYLTRVRAQPPGDVHFPLQRLLGWTLVERVEHAADARHPYAFTFERLERQPAPPP